MKIFIGGLLLGMIITWASNILFIGWYLRERDQVITELMAERNQLLKKIDRKGNYFEKINSKHLKKEADPFGPAKGESLDMIGELYYTGRKQLKSIALPFDWKLIKEEKDKEYRARILKKIKTNNKKG